MEAHIKEQHFEYDAKVYVVQIYSGFTPNNMILYMGKIETNGHYI